MHLIIVAATVAAFNVSGSSPWQLPPIDALSPWQSVYAEEDYAAALDSLMQAMQRGDPNFAEDEFLGLFELLFEYEASLTGVERRFQELLSRAKQAYAEYLDLHGVYSSELLVETPDYELEVEQPVESTRDYTLTEAEAGELLEIITSEGDSAVYDAGRTLPPVPQIDNPKVQNAMRYFLTKGRKVMQIWLNRAAEVIPVLQPILREHGLPDDIVYLAMIESGFNPHAYSWARAAGPWQFIAGTGRRYGLAVDWWFDERRDPVLSTHAAAKYLRDLYTMFGDWTLAFAAYNCGEGKVFRHTKAFGRDFWRLTRLPRQTRNYVPTYFAARTIAENAEFYGFLRPPHQPAPDRQYVMISESVELDVIAECAGVDVEVLRDLNPALIRWCTPPNRDSVRVWLPAGADVAGFRERFDAVPDSKKVNYALHKVRRGETLSTIAHRYGVPAWAIAKHPKNGIRNPNRIKVGQMLIIPGVSGDRAKYAAARYDEPVHTPTHNVHVVRRGETLSEIADRYGLSLSKLRRLNNLQGKKYIYPNQRIRLYAGDRNPPVASVGQINRDNYIVQRGDSLWRIARLHGVTLAKLREANGLERSNRIKPGQRLTIPKDEG